MGDYVSKRQEVYYEEILPSLDQKIVQMDLGMRTNTCLYSAGIKTIQDLKHAISNNISIPMVSEGTMQEIKERLERL